MKTQIIHSINKVGLSLVVTKSRPPLCFLVEIRNSHNVLFHITRVSELIYNPIESSHFIMGNYGSSTSVTQIETTLSFDEKDVSTIFSVLDATNAISQIYQESGIQIHGILGIPFMTQIEWILNFKNLTITK